MGMETVFTIKNRHNDFELCINFYCNYYALDNFVRFNGESIDEYKFIVPTEKLELLYSTIKPMVDTLREYRGDAVFYFDENEYPDSFIREFYGNDFEPFSNGNGVKLLHLERDLKVILNILDLNKDEGFYLEIESSY